MDPATVPLEEDRPEEDFKDVKPSQAQEDVTPALPPVRVVNLVLDHFAFVRGIGNVKRWFNKEYIESMLADKADARVLLNIYIPTYTLHEFDFAKKGTSITASNARDALKLIDEVLDEEQAVPSFGPDGEETAVPERPKLTYNLLIEQRNPSYPNWERCLKYQIQAPKVKDFPYHKTKLANTVLGRPKAADVEEEKKEAEETASVPPRLKHLIRSCVYKKYIDPFHPEFELNNGAQWKLVTEDSVTKVWLNSFGIDCLNVNEAELLIFQSEDVTGFNLQAPGQDFNSQKDRFDSVDRGILHQWVDTTKYGYSGVGGDKRRKPKKGKAKETSPDDEKKAIGPVNPDTVKEEKFGQINYAPRVKPAGRQLYVPKK
ncbi:hypothetical protein FT663_01816 [Candidozyma haemuli var. vulneris]|uniref:PIN domain-containing protein n=1 Tax=Candidozyma haemuli TaxID=45357 RepID=A0A2V1AZ06_9ASCO|nr:hypothetical protein CXQ85_002845 [[Candida] haemuloni]KAF3991062.1 hypothetical protein FT662_01890 [[Candida] haemuloni var. vulneris]KAF3993648.1 hypothetical protein FT663_01816 [[Candida] haemuloni var. vulneris]PVH23118.1 hypothetical protein CXQ85_002845 [[Candida] haemuloni]